MDVTNDTVLDPAHADNDDLPAVAGAPPRGGTSPTAGTPEWEITEDGNQVKHGGRTYVTQEALHAERQRAQHAVATLKQIEPHVPEFVQYLEQKQHGQRATVARAAAPSGGDQWSDDELKGMAITRGYYRVDNQPDTERARYELDLMARIADRSAQKAVGPVQQLSTQDRAAVNYANALNHKFVDGEPVADEKFIRAAFDALPPEYRADKSIADITTVIAAGLQALDERQSGRSRRGSREPDFREGATGRSRNTTSDAIDAFDSAAARASGKTPEQWKAIQKSFGGDSGGGRILEDV